MHEAIDKHHKRSLQREYRVIIISLLFSAALPLSFIFVFTLYFNTWHWVYEPLHSLVESLGSFAAITLALFILIMRRNRQLRPGYLWIASTLMGMGVLDLFHASMPPGKAFIWLHCLATLLGGLTLALVLLPERLASFPRLQILPCATGVCSACIGTFSFFFPEYLPVMGENKKFSLLADGMNTVGGLGFLLAWFHFCWRDIREEFRNERILLVNFTLLFATAALLFNFSSLWSPAWWLMHTVRLLAYLVLLQFFLKIYSRDIGHIRQNQLELKKLLDENNERIKELNCLYGLSRLGEAEHSDTALTHILKDMVELIASSWQHADAAGACIIIDGFETTSNNFEETRWIQEAPVVLNGETRGRVQVCYSQEFPDAYEGPFSKEERHLINEIAVRLSNIIQQKNADIELRKAFEFNKKIIEEFPVGLSVYNNDGKCIAMNSCMKKITGFTQEQQLCSNYNEIDYWQETGLCTAAKQSIALHANVSHDFMMEDASRKHFFFKGIFVPFLLRDEQRLLLMIEDVTERKEAEEDLKSTLLEKESLLKEIHHRVKNNMQIVASLMFLQAQNIKNQEALDILQESQDRVKSMSLVHELLYQSGNLSKVPFKEYVETLVSSLRQSYDAHDILFQIEAESIDLPVDIAVPCGLVVNELITNSFKHAFKQATKQTVKDEEIKDEEIKGEKIQSGILTVRFTRENGICILSVSDNGSGFPTDYDWGSSSTLGLNLIRTLSAQLDAALEFNNQDGLTCRLHFPV
ncbi:MAG: histidine kinase dimerization/phosphoacceptor domain -containing protein [Candidatus Electrothrix sp.]